MNGRQCRIPGWEILISSNCGHDEGLARQRPQGSEAQTCVLRRAHVDGLAMTRMNWCGQQNISLIGGTDICTKELYINRIWDEGLLVGLRSRWMVG